MSRSKILDLLSSCVTLSMNVPKEPMTYYGKSRYKNRLSPRDTSLLRTTHRQICIIHLSLKQIKCFVKNKTGSKGKE